MGSEHRKLFVQLGDLSPDPPHIGLSKLRRMRNMLPLAQGGLCLLSPGLVDPGIDDTNFTNNGLAVPAWEATSLFVHYTIEEVVTGPPAVYSTFAPDLFIGGDADIVMLPGFDETSIVNVSNTALGAYGTGAYKAERWSFATWSWDSVVAVNGSDYPQVFYYGGTGRFTDMIQDHGGKSADSMIASHAAILGKHVVLANIKFEEDPLPTPNGTNADCNTFFGDDTDLFHPDIVWWSATDDETTFGDEVTCPGENTGWQQLNDTPGGITGLVRVGDRALMVFKPNSIYIMELTGSEELFHFSLLSSSIGTTLTKSIVTVGRDVYFISQTGHPYVVRGLSDIEEVGKGVVSTFFGAVYGNLTTMSEDEANPFWITTRMGVPDPFAAYSSNYDSIFWTYRIFSLGEDEAVVSNRCLCYRIGDDKWWDYELSEWTLQGTGTEASGYLWLKQIPIASFSLDEFGYDTGAWDRGTEFPGIVAYDHYASLDSTGTPFYAPALLYPSDYRDLVVCAIDSRVRTKPFGFGDSSVASSPPATIYAIRPVFDKLPPGSATFTIAVTSGQFSDFSTRTSYKATGTTTNASGWYTINGGKVSGELFIVDLNFAHSGTDRNGPHIIGFEIEYSLDGRRP